MIDLAAALVGALLLLGFLTPSRADTIVGRVVRVLDGDTIEVLTPRDPVRIRIAGIDAPELHQPYGYTAKQVMAALVYHRTVTIETRGLDRYGRTLGIVWVDGQDAGLVMVTAGAAWAYRHYKPPAAYLTAEREAQASRRGLWALQPDQITPPWEWRHAR